MDESLVAGDVQLWLDSCPPDAVLPALRAGQRPGPMRVVAIAPLPVGWLLQIAMGDGTQVLTPAIRHDGRWRRAEPGDGLSAALLDAGKPLALQRFLSTPPVAAPTERALGVDMTNDLVVIDDQLVVKWQLEAHPVASPTNLVLEHLSAVHFTGTPEPIASVMWGRVTVAHIFRFVPGATDGWDWMTRDLQHDLAEDRVPRVESAAAVGALLAGFHAAMATPGPRDLAQRSQNNGLEHVVAYYRGLLSAVDTLDDAEMQRALQPWRPKFEAALRIAADSHAPAIMGHGDAHVGQFLRSGDVYLLGDFDGNPMLSAAHRLEPQPTAVDVATCRRSIDHVARIVDRRTSYGYRAQTAEWSRRARTAMLTSYEQEMGGLALDHDLRRALETLSVLHEASYAARYTPAWRHVPLAVLKDR